LGFPTGRSFTSLITRQQVLWHYSSPRHQQVFLAPLPGIEEEYAPTSTTHSHVNLAPSNKFFWCRCRGGRRLLQGEFSHAHPLLCFKFCFTLFLLASLYEKPKKN
jgi:hypothetical protein